MCECVRRVAECLISSMRGMVLLYWENINMNSCELTKALGASVFLFFPVVSPGGCESILMTVLTDGVPLCCVTACNSPCSLSGVFALLNGCFTARRLLHYWSEF